MSLSTYYSTGGDGNGQALYFKIEGQDEIAVNVVDVLGGSTAARIDFNNFPAELVTLLDNLSVNDLLLIYLAAGTPFTPADIVLDIETPAPEVDITLQSILAVYNNIEVNVETPVPEVSITAESYVPVSEEEYSVQVDLGTWADPWEGAILVDPLLIEGGGVAYLRVINPSGGGSLQIRLSDTPTSEPNDPGPAFVDSLLILEDAFTFDSDGNAGSIVLKGPNHPDNSFQDPTEPYFWTPDNGVAFIAWSNAARTQNVTLTLNGGVIGTFIDIEVSIETPVPEVSINPVSYVPVYNDLQVDITTPDPNTVVALSSFVATVHDIVVNIETPAPEAIILLYVLAFGDLRVRVETPAPEANIFLESVQHRILIVDIETPVPEVDYRIRSCYSRNGRTKYRQHINSEQKSSDNCYLIQYCLVISYY